LIILKKWFISDSIKGPFEKNFGHEKIHFFLWLFGISLLLSNSCACTHTRQGENFTALILDSYRLENIAPENEKIEEALKEGESRPRDPIIIILNLFNISNGEGHLLNLNKQMEQGKDSKIVVITVFGVGFLDDSVRNRVTRQKYVREMERHEGY